MAVPIYSHLLVWIKHLRGIIPPLTTLIGMALLLSLGTWQLQRLSWKQDLLRTRDYNQNLPITDLDGLTEVSPFRKVRAIGHFDYTLELQLLGRALEGKMGVTLFTPLRLKDGRIIYVNRGWVPQGTAPINPTQPNHLIEVEGIIREKMSRNFFTPANNYETREIFNFDPGDHFFQRHFKILMPFYIEATKLKPSSKVAILIPPRVSIPNNHLLYAITWFLLAGCLASVYFIYIRRYHRR